MTFLDGTIGGDDARTWTILRGTSSITSEVGFGFGGGGVLEGGGESPGSGAGGKDGC